MERQTSNRTGTSMGGAVLAPARAIAIALVMGVVTLWAVAWYLTDGGARPIGPEGGLTSGHALLIWGAAAAAGFAGALVFRSRALGTAHDARRSGGAEAVAGRALEVQTALVIAWALLEGPALMAGVFFLLLGTEQLLLYAALVYALGVALTFPRAEWFGADERARVA